MRPPETPAGRRAAPFETSPHDHQPGTITPHRVARPVDFDWFRPPAWPERPASIYLWGTSREVLNLALFAVTRVIDPSPYWLEIQGPSQVETHRSPVYLGWVSPDRLYLCDRVEEVAMGPSISEHAVSTLVRADEPAEGAARLRGFARLPSMIQDAVSRIPEESRSRAVAAANVDRIAHLYPPAADDLRVFLAAILRSSISVVVSHAGPANPARFAFDSVFEVRAVDLDSWREGSMICEQESSGGPVKAGMRLALPEVPSVAWVLSRRGPMATAES